MSTDTNDTAKALACARDWLGYATRFGIAAEVHHGAASTTCSKRARLPSSGKWLRDAAEAAIGVG